MNVSASLGITATGIWWIAVCLAFVLGLLVVLAVLGHATTVWVLRLSTIVFGILSVVIGGFLLGQVNWGKILSARPASWESLVATARFLFVATGLTWTNIGADWARYLPPHSSTRAIIFWTTIGATIPLMGLLLLGFLLSSSNLPNLAAAADPVAAIRAVLPAWMAVPYLLTVISGLLSGSLISLYSSGLTLLSLGVPWPRARTVWIDGLVILVGTVYILFFSNGFLGVFQSFLSLIAIGLLSWCAVFLVDMRWRHGVYDAAKLTAPAPGSTYFYWGGVNWTAVGAWLTGVIVGLLFTESPLFSGPLATGIFASSSLGYLLGGLLAGVLYWLVVRFVPIPQFSVPTRQEGRS